MSVPSAAIDGIIHTEMSRITLSMYCRASTKISHVTRSKSLQNCCASLRLFRGEDWRNNIIGELGGCAVSGVFYFCECRGRREPCLQQQRGLSIGIDGRGEKRSNPVQKRHVASERRIIHAIRKYRQSISFPSLPHVVPTTNSAVTTCDSLHALTACSPLSNT